MASLHLNFNCKFFLNSFLCFRYKITVELIMFQSLSLFITRLIFFAHPFFVRCLEVLKAFPPLLLGNHWKTANNKLRWDICRFGIFEVLFFSINIYYDFIHLLALIYCHFIFAYLHSFNFVYKKCSISKFHPSNFLQMQTPKGKFEQALSNFKLNKKHAWTIFCLCFLPFA